MNFIPTNGWPQLKDIPEKLEHFREVYARFAKVNRWYQSIEETELTGNPVIFEKALKLNATALSLNMLPIQSGSGDPSPENIRPISGRTEVNLGRMGKQLITMTLANIKALNTTGTWSDNTYTLNGVIFTVNTDSNGYVVSVTATGNAPSSDTGINLGEVTFTSGTSYKISSGSTGSSDTTFRIWTISNSAFPVGHRLSTDRNLGENIPSNALADETCRVQFQIMKNYTPNGKTVSPMIYLADIDDTTFVPYMGVTLTIALGQTVYGGSLNVKTGVLTIEWGAVDMGDIDWTYRGGDGYTGVFSGTIADYLRTPDVKAMGSAYNYIGTKGGVAVFDSGSSDGEFALLYSNTTDRVIYVKNMDYTDKTTFTAAVTGQKICYELATPQTVQLTGAELALLMGYNYISTDADSLTVKAYTI